MQILDATGDVKAGATGYTSSPLINAADLRRARSHVVTIDRARVPGSEDDVALVAVPAKGSVVVVGSPLEERDDALASLDGLLWLGVPIALFIAGVAGFFVSGRAMLPVDRMRRRADAIGTGDLSHRLPVPPAHDEMRSLAETLNSMLQRLEHGFERERTFVADASHELRTPLARLKAELELASSEQRSKSELRDAVTSSAVEVDALARLADDLLSLARADQGRLPIHAEAIPLSEFRHTLVERTDPTISVTCARDLRVHADPLRLRQAVGNLIDNAKRHGAGHIELLVNDTHTMIEIHALDEGNGIPDSLADTAFERFSRADMGRVGEGAGLGLSIVAAVANAHGGAVGIGHGTDGKTDVSFSLNGAPA